MKKRDYGDYLQDILDSIKDIENFIKDIGFEQFVEDKKTINAVVRSIEIIGEASKNVPAEIKSLHQEIPWKEMAGMRDKLTHEYFGVDLEIVWKTIKQRLPDLKVAIQNIEEMNK